ncbi:MAG TPA: GDSL-type esterase/lipase family protein [Ardenticatenaceae bacterium]|nr:GDSL-type esterase/lipase family protein [Ardenticatenaceae bacterium]
MRNCAAIRRAAAPLLLALLVLPLVFLPRATGSHFDQETEPIIPVIDAPMKARLRGIFLAGQALGRRPGVFAKVGASATQASAFLRYIACGQANLDSHDELSATIAFFGSTTFAHETAGVPCGVTNSFSRDSLSAVSGWSADRALRPFSHPPAGCLPGDGPLRCELRLTRPSIALIMYGTNDLERYNNLDYYRANLTRIVTETIAMGVIPVLSTIPPRLDDPVLGARVATHNQVVVEVARAQRIPLWNYWRALQGPEMVNQGIGLDGIHPNQYPGCGSLYCQPVNFTIRGLRFGYNQRNLTALQVLDKLRRIVIENGPADGAGTPRSTPTPSIAACVDAKRVPFWVYPLESPWPFTSKTLQIYFPEGYTITVFSEAGRTTVDGPFPLTHPVSLTVPLLPYTTHHFTIVGRINNEEGCSYTLRTTHDLYGGPLLVSHYVRPAPIYFPLVRQLPPAGPWASATTTGTPAAPVTTTTPASPSGTATSAGATTTGTPVSTGSPMATPTPGSSTTPGPPATGTGTRTATPSAAATPPIGATATAHPALTSTPISSATTPPLATGTGTPVVTPGTSVPTATASAPPASTITVTAPPSGTIPPTATETAGAHSTVIPDPNPAATLSAATTKH